jgi:hypothetical protein
MESYFSLDIDSLVNLRDARFFAPGNGLAPEPFSLA